MEKKYKTEKDPEGLLRIIALKDFSDVKKGDVGGWIESEANLSQYGDCWVYDYAYVSDNARVSGNARICGNACVYGNAKISGNAVVSDNAQIYGHALVSGNAQVSGVAWVYKWAEVYGNAMISGYAHIEGYVKIFENAKIGGFSEVWDNAKVYGDVKLWSTDGPYVSTSIKNNKDYVILGSNGGEFYIYPTTNTIKLFTATTDITSTATDYIQNIKIIRQLYGKEI